MLVNQLMNTQMAVQGSQVAQGGVNRLLAAAVISNQFCNLLLRDPARALQQGFAGEHFILSNAEQDFILSLHARSLQEFAANVCDHLSARYTVAQPSSVDETDESGRLM